MAIILFLFSCRNAVAMLHIIIIFFSFPFPSLSISSLSFETFPVPSGGPEAFIFDSTGALYTGVNDGRILKYNTLSKTPIDFAHASPKRNKALCDGKADPKLGYICGRTLGLGIHYKTKQLYMADAYHGLCVVGPKGGLATQLLNSVGGQPLKWLDGIDVDQRTGNVYFTDVSSVYNLSQVQESIDAGDSTGRFVVYSPKTKKARVLLTGLKAPGGVGVAKDSSFVLVSEFTGNRIWKYWLKGVKANTAQLLMNTSTPANIKKTRSGEFWVASNIQKPKYIPRGMRINGDGKILETLTFGAPYNNTPITEVHRHRDQLYVADYYVNFGCAYKISRHHRKTLGGGVGKIEKLSP